MRTLLVIGAVLLLWYGPKIWRTNRELRLLLVVSLVYVACLWLQNYEGFKTTGQAVAQQGRYLLPFLIIWFAWLGSAYSMALNNLPKARPIKTVLAIGVIVLLLQGGGFITFIVRSDESWYWQDSQFAPSINQDARTLLLPLLRDL